MALTPVSAAAGRLRLPQSPDTRRRNVSRLLKATLGIMLIQLLSSTASSSGGISGVHAWTPLSDASLAKIPSGGAATFAIHQGDERQGESGGESLLAPILIPRVPGTEGSEKVRQHFVDFFNRELTGGDGDLDGGEGGGWALGWQNRTFKTPTTGDQDIPFVNMIWRRDPPWAIGGKRRVAMEENGEHDGGAGRPDVDDDPGNIARLTLVAHYDSLSQPEGFLGAIDSAAPCAMLMQVARAVDGALTRKWAAMTEAKRQHEAIEKGSNEGFEGLEDDDDDVVATEEKKNERPDAGLQILFLDGEEAFEKWTDDDSLYGARSLAEHWDKTPNQEGSKFRTPLESISLFLLTDLLGAAEPRVPSYFFPTHFAYRMLAGAEKRLRSLGLLRTTPKFPFLPDSEKKPQHFQQGRGFIGDDHVPFMVRGVPVLHVIPTPFPKTWHTMQDDGEHLDLDAVQDWTKMLTAFVAEWMDLEGFLEGEAEASDNADTGRVRDEL